MPQIVINFMTVYEKLVIENLKITKSNHKKLIRYLTMNFYLPRVFFALSPN